MYQNIRQEVLISHYQLPQPHYTKILFRGINGLSYNRGRNIINGFLACMGQSLGNVRQQSDTLMLYPVPCAPVVSLQWSVVLYL